MPINSPTQSRQTKPNQRAKRSYMVGRVQIIYTILIIIGAVFIVRLFYLQVIKHNYYQQAAYNDQLKQYQLPAQRGMILANSGGQTVPLVLNETLYNLFADPTQVKNIDSEASSIQKVIGGDSSTYAQEMRKSNTQYVVMVQKLTQSQYDQINNLSLTGIGMQPENYRIYPDGSLASQLLGFVNGNNQGQYGIEQALNGVLAGTDGQVKAVTDANGVPLVGNKNNIIKNPVNGSNVTLTINLPIQQQLEQVLQSGLKTANSSSGSALIMNPNNGNIVAMANYPTYDPSNYGNVSDPAVYQNATVDSPLEVGSIMKTLTVSAALDLGAVTPSESFYDPAVWNIDGSNVTDIEQDGGPQTRTVTQILIDSLNTGATWMLMQMGGGSINQNAINIWHNYMVNHFHLGAVTGIEQGYEASGYVPSPTNGPALALTFANTAFGQAVTSTPLQMAAAVSAVLNGGTYYVPNLVQSTTNPATGKTITTPPKIWKSNIVKPSVPPQLQQIMEAVINTNYYFYKVKLPPAGYIMGGKTGTAQIAQPGGGYYSNEFNGTFVGFVGTNKPDYVIMVEVNKPNLAENSVDTYAGAGAAAPIFGSITNMLLTGGYVGE